MNITLKAARTNAGLTAKEASEIADIHQQTLLKYEKDSSRIPNNLLNTLSIMYQIEKDDIFLGKEYELTRTIAEKRSEYLSEISQ